MDGEMGEDVPGQAEIEIDDPEGILQKDQQLRVFTQELTKNSEEEGAGKVEVQVRKGKIVVRDDLVHEDAQAIVENLNSERPVSKKAEEKRVVKGGGAGIAWMRNEIGTSRPNGALTYEATEDGKVLARLTWGNRSS